MTVAVFSNQEKACVPLQCEVCLVTASKSSDLPWKLSLYKIFDETCF